MFSVEVGERLAQLARASNDDVGILPSVLSPPRRACQPTVEAVPDHELDIETSTFTTSTSPRQTSFVSSSSSSLFATDIEDEEVEEVVREVTLCRRDINHDILRSPWGLVPPRNFGHVIPGVYRSGFPSVENINFLKTLHLRTILTLVPEEYSTPLQQFVSDNGIQHIRISIEPNKDPFVVISQRNMVAALGVTLDRANHPILIHCNKGKHRTGCVVGCFRKVLGMDNSSISREYNHYAAAKARPLDERFIESFDERSMLWLAQKNNFVFDTEPILESPISALAVSTRLRS